MLHSVIAQVGMKQSYETTDDAPLVVSQEIGKCTIRQMLVDTGSAMNVLFRNKIT